MKKVLAVWFLILMIPYFVTLAWTGQVQGEIQEHGASSGKMVILERDEGNRIMDVEEYLIGVIAKQIPPEYGMEALKAQAVITRTYIYRILGDRSEVMEEELDLDYMEWSQMIEEWGQLMAAEYYQLFQDAVTATAMVGLQYDGEWIEPLFHRVSTGRTRTGDTKLFPYLFGVDSLKDVEAENFLSIATFSESEFAERISEIAEKGEVSSAGIFESIQIVKKDDAGYVEKIQIAGAVYEGEVVQYTLGLPSACFSVMKEEEAIRIVTKGIGHGYGMSQYGAKRMAEDGWKMEDILQYYFTNITLISE